MLHIGWADAGRGNLPHRRELKQKMQLPVRYIHQVIVSAVGTVAVNMLRMMKLCGMSLENKKRRAEEKECHEQRARERIRNKIEKEKLHNDRTRSFDDGLIERKKAKTEAEAAEREKEKREKREERECMERFHHLMDTVEKTREISARAEEIMLRRKKQEEEHKRQMAWFDSQKRG